MKYQGTFGAFNSYIDVGDGFGRRIMLMTDLANLVAILHPIYHQYLENVTNVDIGHIDGGELTTADCPS